MPFSLARFLSPNAAVTVANAGGDQATAEQWGQAIQNLDTGAVGLSTTDTLANKTIGTGWKTAVGSDATGDIYYRDASGNLVRLPIGSASQYLQGGTTPSYTTPPSGLTFLTYRASGIGSATTTFLPLGGGNVSATESIEQAAIPAAITFTKMYAYVDVAPGVGKNIAVTLRKAGVATAITLTISGTNVQANDTAHSATFAAGDLISVQAVSDSGIGANSVIQVILST